MPFAQPRDNIATFGLEPGMIVADLGAGSGFYALAAARAVGETGRVYAVEVQKELLTRIKNTASKEGIYTIEVIWGDLEEIGGSKLRDNSVDRVIVSNILFQLENHELFTREAFRILRPHGEALIVEWSGSFGGVGPRPEQVIAEADARALFERNGFSFVRSLSNPGEHHYGFIVKKP